ncbi:calcium-dependent phosphotriesterase [Lizonia empirigonia]|nr:calcium-dependent phosphotriesterase [Lizonia empirigonia]
MDIRDQLRLSEVPNAVVAWSAAIYQFLIKDILTVSLGLGRAIQTIDEFPFSCQRIEHPQLEACEDLWLDEADRTLYAACAGTKSRMAWNPAISRLDVSGRRPTGSEIVAFDIDSIAPNGFFSIRSIRPVGAFGARGDAVLDTVGFTAEPVVDSTIRFYFPNFPNRPAAVGGGAFLVTNDHGVKVGWRKQLEPIIGGGTVAYCDYQGDCHSATLPPGLDIRKNLRFPNGLAKGEDGLIYVPSSADGTIKVFTLQPNQTLTPLHTIRVGMPLDNVSPDARGDLWVPGFPDTRQKFKGMADPYLHHSPATVFRVRKVKNAGADGKLEYEVEKMIEDKEGKVISGATTVVHDVKTGRLFIGAAVSPYLVVCEPKR